MSSFFDKKIWLSFVISLILFTWVVIQSYQENEKFLTHTREIILLTQMLFKLEQVHTIAVDIETGQRGYTITGDSAFLEPFIKAQKEIGKNIDDLILLTINRPDQNKKIFVLKSLVAQKKEFTTKAVLARHENFDSSRQLEASYEGKRIMDGIRSATGALQKETSESLAHMRGLREKEMRAFNNTFLIVITTALLLLVFAFISIHYSVAVKAKTQRALLSASNEIQDLYDNAPCGYHSLNGDGIFISMNATERRWLGYESGEVIGKMKFTDLLYESEVPYFFENFEKFKRDGIVNNLEFRLRKKDGTVMNILLNASAIKDKDGRLVRTRTTLYDITERKKMEAELHRVTEKLLDLYDNAPCGYFSVNEHGVFTNANKTFLSWLLYTREELVGKKLEDILTSSSRAELEAVIPGLRKRGYVDNAEAEIIRRNGRTLAVLGNASLEKDEKGNVLNIRCTVFDNSERKKADLRIRQLNEELESFSYSVSHDLRRPLRLMNNYAQILKEDYFDKLDEEGNRVVDSIISNAGSMGRLIDDLLQFARLGRQEVVMSVSDFSNMIAATLRESAEIEQERKIDIKVHKLEPVLADVRMMQHVWSNLISNAIKYSSKKEQPMIEIGSYRNNGKVCYYVKDNGVGFNTAYKEKLFNVFQRLHRPDEFPGTGVGLAVVKKIVTRHGGQVWAESKLNEGSTFYFSLPYHGSEEGMLKTETKE